MVKVNAKIHKKRKKRNYEVRYLALKDIKTTEDRRETDWDAVARIAESIKEIGLHHPLTVQEVNGEFLLVTGHHRYEAVRKLGWKTVPCLHVKGELTARIWAIDENLNRNEYTALEESLAIVKRVELSKKLAAKKAKSGKVGRPKGGAANDALHLPGSGTAEAKRKQLVRARKIASLEPKVQKAILKAGLDDNQEKLLKVAKLQGEKTRLAIVQRLAGGNRKKPAARKPSVKENQVDTLKREYKKATGLRQAWMVASLKNKASFIKKVLKFPFDGA
jgi:ParB/RepB/Spo0J family partition protein